MFCVNMNGFQAMKRVYIELQSAFSGHREQEDASEFCFID